jgi:glyceraldehyde-3-phosphate dehydrogenase (ferredoxin)
MASEPSVVLLNHKAGEIQVRIEPVNVEPLWAGYASPDGRPLIGFFALQQALFDRYAGEYTKGNLRICAVVLPRNIRAKAHRPSPVRNGAFTALSDWAGHGGLGVACSTAQSLASCSAANGMTRSAWIPLDRYLI